MTKNIYCPFCHKKILKHNHVICCYNCNLDIHKSCTGLTTDELAICSQSNIWYCRKCNEDIFVFNHIDDECEFRDAIYHLCLNRPSPSIYHYNEKIFNPFDINEDDHDMLYCQDDIDPDKCFYSELAMKIQKPCNYMLADSFNNKMKHFSHLNANFPAFHLNIRSLPANLSHFLAFMENLEFSFGVIGFTETWLTPDNITCYSIDGYSHVGITRQNGRRGGGVSLFISDIFHFSEMHDLSIVNENIECLFVNVIENNSIVCVVYRPPNADIDVIGKA